MSVYPRKDVGDLVRRQIDEWKMDAWEINNGWCFGFASQLAKKFGVGATLAASLGEFQSGTFPGHWWVRYGGLHFDAESPDGEDDPSHMQYHRRLRAIADSPDDKDEDEAVIEALGRAPIYYGGLRI